jgi:hypothetical protein
MHRMLRPGLPVLQDPGHFAQAFQGIFEDHQLLAALG